MPHPRPRPLFAITFSVTVAVAVAAAVAVAVIAVTLGAPSLPLRNLSLRRATPNDPLTPQTAEDDGDAANPSSNPPTNPSTTTTSTSTMSYSIPFVMPAVSRHTATVIFVHGLGDSGRGWEYPIQMLQKKRRLDEVKFVLPNAPTIPITVNRGWPAPGWFDVKTLGSARDASFDTLVGDEDEAGILKSRDYLHSLIQKEIDSGIPADRIVLGGFSQGGAMSLFSGLTAPVKLGGIVALSCWLVLSRKFNEFIPEGDLNKATPIFMGQGDRDPVVLPEWAQASQKALKDMDYDVTFKTYSGMVHTANESELDEVESFIASRLPAKGNQN